MDATEPVIAPQSPRATAVTPKWLIVAALLLALSPAIVPLLLIHAYGVNVPFWDQWNPNIAGLFIKVHAGQFPFAELVAQHNEHRLVVPRVIFLVLGFLSGWNVFVEMIAGWVLAVITSAAVLLISTKTVWRHRIVDGSKQPGLQVIGLWFLANTLIFSIPQAENWLWGMGMVNFLPMLFTVAGIAVCCAAMNEKLKLILLVLVNLAATYSAGAGILAWPLTIGLLAGLGSWKDLMQRRWSFLILILSGAIAVGAYFIGYTKPPPAEGNTAVGLADMIHYFAAFLGGMFAFARPRAPISWGTFSGASLCAMWVAAFGYVIWLRIRGTKPELCRRMIPWLAIGAFAVLNASLATINRSGLGILQGLSSRYVTFSLYLPLSLVYLLHLVVDDLLAARATSGAMLRKPPGMRVAILSVPIAFDLALLVTLLMTWPFFRYAAVENQMIPRLRGKATMLLCKVLPDDPLRQIYLYPDAPLAVREADALSDMGFFRPRLIESRDANAFAISSGAGGMIGSLTEMKQFNPQTFGFRGWAYSARRSGSVDCVFLTYETDAHQSIILATTNVGLYRDDERQPIDPRYLRCGWVGSIPIANLPAEPKTLVITAWALDAETGKATRLEGGFEIKR